MKVFIFKMKSMLLIREENQNHFPEQIEDEPSCAM